MPSWSQKRERQYEKIKESQTERGVPEKRAKSVAARTVNKQRRESGETPNKRTSGTGNPNTPLTDRSKDELYNRASDMNIKGRSRMTKDELISAIQDRRG